MIDELLPEQLRRTVDPDTLGIETTENLLPLQGIIGQPRAVSALLFGLDIQDNGFNIYVAGPPGIGKMTAIQSFLDQVARNKPTPADWCYINNFDDPYQPQAISLPAGRGRQLQRDVKTLIDHARREIPKAFETEEYTAKQEDIKARLDRARTDMLEQFNQQTMQAGFAAQATPMGIAIIPVRHGHPMKEAEFNALPEAQRQEIERSQDALKQELRAVLKQIRDRERAAQDEMQALEKQVASYVIDGLIEDLREKYQDVAAVVTFTQALQKDILENLEPFKSNPDAAAMEDADKGAANRWLQQAPFRRYQVNVLVDNSKQQGGPVVVELNPSYGNLFGRIEKENHEGLLYTDLGLIKGGSLHRANGGYLVLPVEDLLRNLYSWDALKGALRSGEVEIEELGERLGYGSTPTLRPQPVPLNVKVVLVGSPLLYYLLHENDEKFPELFKVKAEFDNQMPYSHENIQSFVTLIQTICARQGIKPLDKSALARLLEYASRLAEDQDKLSTQFGALINVIHEANYWAEKQGKAEIDGTQIQRAIDQKIYRSNLLEERMQEMIADKSILIDTAGAQVGQVNGLAVLSLGEYDFGRPSRITASVGPGREGIIDIEREVELGGPLHSKGVLILSGHLRQKYAADRPLTLAARLVFEQSYEGIEGDSASSAELYALLSALANVPIKQAIAVTGSVNQFGEVQAIGCVNEKIEGFFDVCCKNGLTGDQGVIIPRSNVQNLMLRGDVVEAVKQRRFHVWGVETIDQGIEILTGMLAGERGPDGCFVPGSVNDRVDRRLREFARCWGQFLQFPGADGKDLEPGNRPLTETPADDIIK